MSRKTFLSTDFFVTASEKDAKEILLSLPGHLSQLTLLKEDTIIHSTRFLFSNEEKATQYYVDVTILQLNDQFVRFSLHGSYTNGQMIQSDAEIKAVLAHFEKSIYAVVNNDFSSLQVPKKPSPAPRRTFSVFDSILSLVVSKYHY
jgi:hypothetical protein